MVNVWCRYTYIYHQSCVKLKTAPREKKLFSLAHMSNKVSRNINLLHPFFLFGDERYDLGTWYDETTKWRKIETWIP